MTLVDSAGLTGTEATAALLGGVFGFGVHELFPHLTAERGAYALVGMGGLLAGVRTLAECLAELERRRAARRQSGSAPPASESPLSTAQQPGCGDPST